MFYKILLIVNKNHASFISNPWARYGELQTISGTDIKNLASGYLSTLLRSRLIIRNERKKEKKNILEGPV